MITLTPSHHTKTHEIATLTPESHFNNDKVAPENPSFAPPPSNAPQTKYLLLNDIPIISFSISSSQKTTPKDILQEIAFHSGAGGGGPGTVSEGPCPGDYYLPTIKEVNGETEPFSTIKVMTCGWQNQETVDVTLELPDGTSITESKIASDRNNSAVSFFRNIALTDPLGIYTLTLKGSSGELQIPLEVQEPQSPRLYNFTDEYQLLLYKFKPMERVRLLAYQDLPGGGANRYLVGWEEYQTDSEGRLFIRYDEYATFIIIGDDSGEAILISPSRFYEFIR